MSTLNWMPSTDFEEEIVGLQPNHNFIFGELSAQQLEVFYPRPKSHLQYIAKKKQQKQQQPQSTVPAQHHKLNVIAKIQRIAGTKPLGEQPTVDDWDSDENVERETVAMMRYCGLGPSIEEPLNEKCTIATLPINADMEVMHNGRKRLPIFFDEKFFKLQPRISNSSSGIDSGDTSMFSAQSFSNSSASVDSANTSLQSMSFSKDVPNYEKLNETTSSANSSLFETAKGTEDEIYMTANNSVDFIPSRAWYRSDNSSGGSSNNSYSLTLEAFPPINSVKAPRSRLYTTKELYDMKRHC